MAQTEQDALDLSQEEITGSARSVAMGGAFTALGGDFSAVQLNPASTGVFRSNEFNISAAFHTSISQSDYYGTNTLGSRSNFNFPTLGIVATKNLRAAGRWRSSSIAFGMNRQQSFYHSISAEAPQVANSMIDDYINTLNEEGIEADDFGEGAIPYPFDIFLAWNNYLIDTLGGPDYYNATGTLPVSQRYSYEQTGAKRNTFFSYGANYDDKLYLGGAITLSRIIYSRAYTISEATAPSDSTTVLDEYSFNFDEDIEGYGIAASLGAIYRPINTLRIGLSVISPTVYSLTTQYETSNTAIFLGDQIFETLSPSIGTYDFRLSTPLRSNIGIAYIIGKYGLISADAEYVDYNIMTMEGLSDGYSFSSEENAIKTQLQKGINLRFGGEYRLNSFASLRAGYAYYSNPYNTQLGLDGSFQLYSLGFGYRTDEFYIDGAYQLKQSESTRYLYDPALVEPIQSSFTDHRVTVTFGYRF